MNSAERKEFEAAQYALRATFYYRAHGLWGALQELLSDRGVDPPWNYEELGISERAVKRVHELGISLWKVFAHPQRLVEEPRLVRYYRCLALLPQKGLQRLAFGTTALEEGRGRLSKERALRLCLVLNGLISLQIDSDPEWTMQAAETAALLNLGSQINGSWRNEIGEEGARLIRSLLTSHLSDLGVLKSVTLSDHTKLEPPVKVEDAAKAREIVTSNGYVIRFGAEPDVSVVGPSGSLVGTVEVKYGSDPAGALERYGAAKKSFEKAARVNAKVKNIYLANVITEEVRRRIGEDRLVTEVFEIRDILHGEEREHFLRYFTRQLLDL